MKISDQNPFFTVSLLFGVVAYFILVLTPKEGFLLCVGEIDFRGDFEAFLTGVWFLARVAFFTGVLDLSLTALYDGARTLSFADGETRFYLTLYLAIALF